MNLHFFQSVAHKLSNLIWAKTSLAADINSAIEQLERKIVQKNLELHAAVGELDGLNAQLNYLKKEQANYNAQNSLHNPS